MIVLDTNVLSELLRPAPDPAVIMWLGGQTPAQVFTTAITEAEIRYGVARLESGRRRDGLMTAITAIFAEDFAGRVLAFNAACAPSYAEIVVTRERSGRPISQFDAQIAAIGRMHDAAIATRNVKDFEGLGLTILNPFS
jgi:predicted nucleic acid-binding protein